MNLVPLVERQVRPVLSVRCETLSTWRNDHQSGATSPVPTVGNGIARDTSGRFIAGNSGNGGRRKGARNRLKETFLSAVADHFAEHGKAALDKLATDDPATYLRIMASFVPREPAKFEELGDLANDEIVELIEQAERHRLVQGMIEAGDRKP